MEYRKRIVKRLIIHAVWLLVMLSLSAIAFFVGDDSMKDFALTFAVALTVATAVRIVSGVRLLRNGEELKKREIAENDERNLSISLRAKGTAFVITVFAACGAVLVLRLLGMVNELKTLCYCICFMLVVYYFAYYILQKKG